MKTDWLDELNTQEIELNSTPNVNAKVEVKVHKKSTPVNTSGKLGKRPWVEITGEAIDSDKGIRLALDWNNEFIQYLKQNGITGADEEQIVQKYITLLYRELIEQMGTSSEFE